MTNSLQQRHYFLVGIKGVAMTALAQVLLDAGHTVRGSDVEEAFVTQAILDTLPITIDSLTAPIPDDITHVVYTAAHGGAAHQQVVAARAKNLTITSHAQELALWFNQKTGIAVCGVGGKSTISAMITWILEKTGREPSYAVGVGSIIGLDRTGRWSNRQRDEENYFVVEADEYATNPEEVKAGLALIPRFHYYQPNTIVSSSIVYDHPDVYRDFKHTVEVYTDFFTQLRPMGSIITQEDNIASVPLLAQKLQESSNDSTEILTFGTSPTSSAHVQLPLTCEPGRTTADIVIHNQTYKLQLQLPGAYNVSNALAALLAVHRHGVPIAEAIEALANFQSTSRRFENKGIKSGVQYYDDYAHHPRELVAVLAGLREWYPNQRRVVAFQSHTFSRTKELFEGFVDALAHESEVVMIDIFASARESADQTISSNELCEHLVQRGVRATNVHTIDALAEYCQSQLQPGDVCITLGAGDIYHVHELIT